MNGYRRWAHIATASTGNDLVFLPATRPERTSLPRFFSRILTAAEAEAFHGVAPSGLRFDHYVWLCWSIKESVYKYKKRLNPDLVFAPLRIVVSRIEPPSGDQHFYTGVVGDLYSRSLIREDVMVTVVSGDQDFRDTRWGFAAIDSPAYADQCAAVRALAIEQLSAVLSRDDLRLQKDAAGCPIVMAGDTSLDIPVSLAHHERYIAYSFLNKVL